VGAVGKVSAEFDHPVWKQLTEKAKGAGHGGMDFIQAYRLIHALRHGRCARPGTFTMRFRGALWCR